jgi:hypothetical protein
LFILFFVGGINDKTTLMQRPWWKHPEWIHLYAILGAIVGANVIAIAHNLTTHIAVELLSAQVGMHNILDGLSGLFFGIRMIIYLLVLGGLSGYFITHLFGKYRAKLAPIGLIITGIFSVAFVTWSAKDTWGLMLMSRRATLANYGSCTIYSLILIICGILILRRKTKS